MDDSDDTNTKTTVGLEWTKASNTLYLWPLVHQVHFTSRQYHKSPETVSKFFHTSKEDRTRGPPLDVVMGSNSSALELMVQSAMPVDISRQPPPLSSASIADQLNCTLSCMACYFPGRKNKVSKLRV